MDKFIPDRRLKGEVNSFVTNFLEALPNAFTAVTENY